MLKNYNRYKILKVFLDSPTETFRLRELSRLSDIPPLSVKNYLKEFEKEELIKKFEKRGIPFYKAIRDNEKFILYKKISILYELNETGLIDKLWDSLSPEAIILYGSFAKGESTEDSDIDIFIIGKEKEIDLKTFEKKIGRHIHLMFEQDTKNISKELKNNLINGVILKGYWKVF
ncbi:MAG: nucleotidyltransferase domain-containing protein [Candidatus Nanoarchaeia archaeon]|nr:nucleotidyltransferase domain-containing protein [Candidatus Nanoarchaeia archaeon]MDD5588210.1 nucleotidyltransferase domain-containing protein [Candidatus Nanoarchaeia archaeon]